MASASANFDHKKKSLHHADHIPRDGNGMSFETKRHFDHVKQKMLAFINLQHRREVDAMHLSPPMHRQVMFADQKKLSKHRLVPPSPSTPSRKHSSAHRQLQHLGLVTPQMVRRSGKP